mgnify:FL=1
MLTKRIDKNNIVYYNLAMEQSMNKEITYYYFDHTNLEAGEIGDFGKLVDFIDNDYDKDKHSIHDCLESNKMCIRDNTDKTDLFEGYVL